MADNIVNNQKIESSRGGVRNITYKMSSGSAKLQALAGKDASVSADWVDVPDSSVTTSTNYSFYASPGQLYRVVLTGDAEAWISG